MPLADKRSLIIGADGFLGRNLIEYFRERGWRFIAIGRSDGDLSDWATVERLLRETEEVDRIFHLVTHQWTGPAQYDIQGRLLAVNSRIHLNILEAWRLHQPQAKLISTGSSCAYPESDAPLPESAFQSGPVHLSVRGYALAKQMLAVGSQVYAEQYGLHYLHCVLATMYGPYDHKEPDRSHFMGAMLDRAIREKAEGKQQFSVWGNANTVRELLFVTDQIEAILAANQAFDNTLLHCTASQPVTIGEAAQAVLDVLAWPVEPVYLEGTFQGARYKVLDSSRFLDATGWQPRFRLVDGLRIILETDYQLMGSVTKC
jgi:GDP-L-fucose synthase